ncbi:MAG TPA: hypothetical protein VMH78_08440 [Thermoplasmata archaeon]|nr:hypothetical protein [Thermoplasmata archaeon]
MVNGALFLAGTIGVVLSATFLYAAVGPYATPRVAVSRFDERKALIAYAAGLFAGIVVSVPYGLAVTSLAAGAFLAGLLGVVLFVLALEIAGWLLLRSRYFGTGTTGPFYAVGLRGGISAIIVLTLCTLVLGAPTLDLLGVGGMLLESGAIVVLLGTGALYSIPRPASGATPGGGPVSGALLTGAGLFFLVLAGSLGELAGAIVAALVLVTVARLFVRTRESVLGGIRPGPAEGEPTGGGRFGRTDLDRGPE